MTPRTSDQTVTVEALAGVWLPAAYEPRALDAGDAEVDWDQDSSTLIVDRDVPTSDGLKYEVTSAVPGGRRTSWVRSPTPTCRPTSATSTLRFRTPAPGGAPGPDEHRHRASAATPYDRRSPCRVLPQPTVHLRPRPWGPAHGDDA